MRQKRLEEKMKINFIIKMLIEMRAKYVAAFFFLTISFAGL
jgi:hypothetical protein